MVVLKKSRLFLLLALFLLSNELLADRHGNQKVICGAGAEPLAIPDEYDQEEIIEAGNNIGFNIHEEERSWSIECITESDVSVIAEALLKYKGPEYIYTNDMNILNVLKDIPNELAKKLKVVIATHEGNELTTYFGTRCGYHMLLLGKTEKGLIIFDTQVEDGASIKPDDWIKCVYNNYCISFTLMNSYTIRNLPQFRFVNGLAYLYQYKESDAFEIQHPDFALRNPGVAGLKSPLWEKSFSLNLYEVYQFFMGGISYEDVLSRHQDFASPIARLKQNEIAFLREVFKSPNPDLP